MPIPRTTSTADLLLQLLEHVSLGPTSHAEAEKHLRRTVRRSGLSARVTSSLAILEAEGLVTRALEDGEVLYRVTPAGLETLERQGRFPRGATVLFTDLVGSTALIGAFGESGAHERRLRHFALLRSAIEQYGGREVKSLGDGLMVVFADPTAAVACAQEMQRSVAADPDGLGLRVGLHTGELLRVDDDFHGTTVIVAARLCNAADAGQIIVSEETRAETPALTTGTGEEPIEPLGSLSLKGLSKPVPAFTLRWTARSSAPGEVSRSATITGA